MRAFLWRLLHAHNDKITACRFWYYMRSCEVAFLPTVGFFCELAVGIVNVNGYLCLVDFGSEPKPVFVSFEQLLSHGFLLSRSKISSPIILADLETLFDVRFGGLKRKRLRVVDRSKNRRPQCCENQQQRACPDENLHKAVHGSLILCDDPLAKSRSDVVNLLHCLGRNPAITNIDQGFHL